MKAAPFDYIRATSLAHLCDLLADRSIDSRVIAGGQTLVPLMAMRLVHVDRLIDISRISSLHGISTSSGIVTIGAMTRQSQVEHSSDIARLAPLLHRVAPWIGHQQTRNRGTVGGSLCNADPSAEIGLVCTALEAQMHLRSARGKRKIDADTFLVDAMETSLDEDEFLTHIDIPVWDGSRSGIGFEEVNARASDFALIAAAVQLELDEQNRCSRIACAVAGASPSPIKARETEKTLSKSTLDDSLIDEAAARINDRLDPGDDVHASATYRRRVAPQVLARAIREARDAAVATETDK